MPNNWYITKTFEKSAEKICECQRYGKEEKIEVKNDSGRLTKEDIERMVAEAEKYSEEDNKLKERIEAKNALENTVYQIKSMLSDEKIKDSFSPENKEKVEKEESERKETYKDFKEGGCRVLITSDLFARGIDVQQVSIVINFDIPKNEHTYLHRIGRSGRWGRKGVAINFQTKYDIVRLKKFEEFYNTQIVEMPANYMDHLNM